MQRLKRKYVLSSQSEERIDVRLSRANRVTDIIIDKRDWAMKILQISNHAKTINHKKSTFHCGAWCGNHTHKVHFGVTERHPRF